MKARFALSICFLTCACSLTATAPLREVPANEIDAAGTSEASARPSFDLDESSALRAIKDLGAPWSVAPLIDDTKPDSLTLGSSRSVINKLGSADVYTLPDGHVWRIVLRTGFGNRCGKRGILIAALPKLLSKVAPATGVDPLLMRKLSAALAADTIEEADLAGAKVNVSGSCIAALSVSATSKDLGA